MDEQKSPVVLKSPYPFERLGASMTFSFALFIIPLGVLWLNSKLFDPDTFMATAFMIIGTILFLIIIIMGMLNYKSITDHMKIIYHTNFKITNDATLELIYNRTEPALRKFYGEKITFSLKNDCVIVACNAINYKIILNDDSTFSVKWQKSLFDKLLSIMDTLAESFGRDSVGGSLPVWKYDKVRTETPRIAYEVQQAFGITASENEDTAQELERFYKQEKKEEFLENHSATASDTDSGILGKLSRHRKILVTVTILGLTIIGMIFSNGNKDDKESIMYAYKLIGGRWFPHSENNGLLISTRSIRETGPYDETPYKITSVSKNSKSIDIKLDIGGRKGEISIPKNNLNEMTFKYSSDKQAEHYYLSNDPYPRNLENNLDLIFIYGRMGHALYLDLNSIKVEKRADGEIHLTENLIGADGNFIADTYNFQRTETLTLKYTIVNGVPYSASEEGGYRVLDINDTTGSNSLSREGFLTGFFYAFGYNFNDTMK